MSDPQRLVNLRRCARGNIVDAGEATNTTVALTNNSLGAELLMVWTIAQDADTPTELQLSYQQNLGLNPGGIVQAVVPGDAPPPGILSSGDLPSAFPPDWTLRSAALTPWWYATFPFAVLLPYWSLVFQGYGGGAIGVGVNLFWEAILPQYFDRFYSHRFIDVILASQGG